MNMRRVSMKMANFSCISLLICGCEAKHLAYVHETSFGLDIAISNEGSGRLVMGYDRDTYALVPRKGEGEDAMTLSSLGCIYASGLDEVSFNHFISSGEAAKQIAKSPTTLSRLNQAIQGEGLKCKP
jgi:hypothetical protein